MFGIYVSLIMTKIISFFCLFNFVYVVNAQEIAGPAGSGEFGSGVTVLKNGDFVITDPLYDEGTTADVGAVYLYNGLTKTLISTLKGSSPNDRVGIGGVVELSNGNFVVVSYYWNNGSILEAGAVTFVNGTTGLNGVVSSANSLIGTSTNDQVGSVKALNNGDYLVISYLWNNGSFIDAGAVTRGNGNTGISGEINSGNSLTGSKNSDKVGIMGVTELPSGNYVINSKNWNGGFGAVTWVDGNLGLTGTVSASNSLVGSATNDQIGKSGIVVLTNGNYLVVSDRWKNGSFTNAGAVTWANGTTGIMGAVSATNSLVGNSADVYLGAPNGGANVIPLTNGNYVVIDNGWDNGSLTNVGAVTWGDGTTGITGVINLSNSLVGSSAYDLVGDGKVIALSNGNYAINSPQWNKGGMIKVGAVTVGNGATGTVGKVTMSNSFTGTNAYDKVGESGLTALQNGKFVINSSSWHNVGAVTLVDGLVGLVGNVDFNNSLVGSTNSDYVGFGGITVLTNGNYVVSSPFWDKDSIKDVGAITWVNGITGLIDSIHSNNSLIGSTAYDKIGSAPGQVLALTNGNYAIGSPIWDNGIAKNAGAVTWADGSIGISGEINALNSLVGTAASDYVGNDSIFMYHGMKALPNGNYTIASTDWDNASLMNAGAVTYADGSIALTGSINSCNSVVGDVADAVRLSYLNPVHNYLIVPKLKNNSVLITNKLFQSNPSFFITSDDADQIICLDSTTTFTAITANAGTAPSYQWKFNNADVSSETNTTFTPNGIGASVDVTCGFVSGSCTLISNTISITIANCIGGIDDISDSFAILVFPNPSSGMFEIKGADKNEIELIQVYDCVGKLVLKTKKSQYVNLDQFTSGIYHIHVVVNGVDTIQKVHLIN